MKVVFAISFFVLLALLIGWTVFRGKTTPPDTSLHNHPSNFTKPPIQWTADPPETEETLESRPDLGEYL